MGYSRKKQTSERVGGGGVGGGRGGWGHKISRGIEEKACGNIKGLAKKEVKLPGVMKKKSCGIPMGLGFQSWNFQEVSYKLAEFSGVKACFFWNFQFQGFSQKSISSPLPMRGSLDIFSNSQTFVRNVL